MIFCFRPGKAGSCPDDNLRCFSGHGFPSVDFLLLLLSGLVCFGPLVWMNGLFDFTDLPKGIVIQSWSLIILAAWLGVAAWRAKLHLRNSQILLFLLLFLIWSGVSLLYAHNRVEGYWPLLRWLPLFPIVLLGASILYNPVRRRCILTAIGLSGALSALLGLVQSFSGWSPVEQVSASASSFANSNMAADFIVLTLSVNIGFAIDGANLRRRLFAVAAVVLTLLYLITTCRMAWLSITVQSFCWCGYAVWRFYPRRGELFCRGRVSGALLLTAVTVSLIFLFHSALFSARFPVLEERITAPMRRIAAKGGLSSGRVEMWLNTLEMIKDRPLLGVGLGNHKVEYPPYRSDPGKLGYQMEHHIHNDFLQIIAETGIIGFSLLLLLFLAAFRVYRSNFYRIFPGQPALGLSIIFAFVGGFFVSANVSFSLYRAAPPLILAAFLAIIASVERGGRRFHVRGNSCRLFCSVGLLLVLAAFLLHLFWAKQLFRADRLHRRLVAADSAGRWDQGINIGAGILELKSYPWRLRSQLYLGRALIELRFYDKAAILIDEFIAAYPYHLNAWYNLGLAYEGAGHYANAARAFEKTVSLNPQLYLGYERLGYCRLRNNENAAAERAFRAALVCAAAKDKAEAWNNYGRIAVLQRDYLAAENRFQNAIAANPGDAVSNINLGILYLRYFDRSQESLRLLKRGVKLNPEIPGAAGIRQMIREFEASPETDVIRRLILKLEMQENNF